MKHKIIYLVSALLLLYAILNSILYSYSWKLLIVNEYKEWGLKTSQYGIIGDFQAYSHVEKDMGIIHNLKSVNDNVEEIKVTLLKMIIKCREDYKKQYDENKIKLNIPYEGLFPWDDGFGNSAYKPNWILFDVYVEVKGKNHRHACYIYHAEQVFGDILDFTTIQDKAVVYTDNIYEVKKDSDGSIQYKNIAYRLLEETKVYKDATKSKLNKK